MATEVEAPEVYVLTLEAVRWAIQELQSQPIHPFFLAYLHLRQRAAEQGSTEEIQPQWEQIGQYLRVPGGPPGKPYYRPFVSTKGSDPARFWLNQNLAGSYAPSSLRSLPRKVVGIEGNHFSLLPNHAQAAKEHLLKEIRVSAVALAAYFYRDFGFTVADREPTPADLVEVLRQDFLFGSGEPDFAALFVTLVPAGVAVWFEPLTEETIGVE